ncbi:MAG TPA: hypothetical protein VGJ03_00730 [Acidimicrobiales bacterium]|jgi:hypothetical protein
MGFFARKQDAIDLRDAPAKPAHEFGLPTPCPHCGGHGYLEGIDMKRRIMLQRCTSCYAKWETSESDLTSRPG